MKPLSPWLLMPFLTASAAAALFVPGFAWQGGSYISERSKGDFARPWTIPLRRYASVRSNRSAVCPLA